MVIIYKVLARFNSARGFQYSEVNYFLNRSAAYREASRYFNYKGKLSAVDKVLIQEISIGPDGAGIRNVDYVSEPT